MKFRGSYFSYILTYFFYFFSMAIFSSILSVYLTGIGKSPQEMSFIVSSSSFSSLIFLPFIGMLNDKLKQAKLVNIILLLMTGILGLFFARTSDVLLLFFLNGFIMLGINAVMPVCERIAGDSKYRYGSIRVWGTIGFAVGAQTAGFAIEYISPSFIFIFLFISILITIFGFLNLDSAALQPANKDNLQHRRPGSLKQGLVFLKDRNFLLFLLIAFLCSGSSAVNMTYVPVLLTELNISVGAVGTVISISTLTEIPVILFSHKFMDKYPGKVLLFGSFSLLLVQFLCYGFIHNAGVIIAVIIVVKATASTLFMMIMLKMVRNIVSRDSTNTALSFVSATNSLAAIVLQNAGGYLIEKTSIPTLYLMLAGLTVLGIILSSFLKARNDEKVFS